MLELWRLYRYPEVNRAMPKKATKRPRRASAAATRKPKKKPARKTSSPRGRAAKTARPAAKRAAAKPARRRQRSAATSGYLSKINDWRQDCVAALGKILRSARVPDPRKLISPPARKAHAARLARLKAAGKKELHELVRFARRLQEAAAAPERPRKSTQPK
jgi:hypothetical protein